MAKVLITGGTGGLGSELVPRFAASGYHVRIMSRRPAPATAQQQWAQADLATGEGLAEAVAGVDLIYLGLNLVLGATDAVEGGTTEQ